VSDPTERWRIGREVERLGEPEKTVVMLYYHAELDASKIAQVLDTSPECVEAIRTRALTRIREAVGL
jgi:DNA-directed RNA polymerase specialized sigma subunit